MDRLVKVSTDELSIPFTPNHRCSTTFQLTNLMHTMPVAVSLTTTTSTAAADDPPLFTITQPLSILPSLSTATYTLSLSRSSQAPPPPLLASPPPTLLVRTAVLPTGKAHPTDLRRLFSASPGRRVFKDAALPIFLVGPQIAHHLISSNSSSHPDLMNLFCRSISRCPVSDLNSLLFSAVRASADARLVCELVRSGADVNGRDGGQSLVSVAVGLGRVGVVRALIESGCDVGGEDLLMHRAAEMNRVDLMRVLGFGWDSVDSNGRSPVHVSASFGHFEALKLCVSMGGDPDRVDSNGFSPLHCAAENGDVECVEFLLDCSVYSKYAMSKDGRTPFLCAMDIGHSHLMDLLRLGDVLSRAARVGDGHGLENCIGQGAMVNGKDQNGWTPLHRAAFKGEIEIVKALIGHGAQIDLVDDMGYTPLHCAVEAGRVQVAMYLIAQGARWNLKSIKGVCPLNFDFHKKYSAFVSPLCSEIEQALEIES